MGLVLNGINGSLRSMKKIIRTLLILVGIIGLFLVVGEMTGDYTMSQFLMTKVVGVVLCLFSYTIFRMTYSEEEWAEKWGDNEA